MSVLIKTSVGDLKIRLHYSTCRDLCFNFIALCATGFYDTLKFHRNIPGFIAQSGKPLKGKGKSIDHTYLKDEFSDRLKHDKRGIVSMANNGPNKNGSQFFITYSAQAELDGKFCVIGELNDFDVAAGQNEATLAEMERTDDVFIDSVIVLANPFALS